MTENNAQSGAQNDDRNDPKDVPDYVLVGSNFHSHRAISSLETYPKKTSAKVFPPRVTLGFRNNFWRVFSKVDRHDVDDRPFEWLGRSWVFRELWTAESTDVDFAHYLQDQKNIFVLFVLSPHNQDEYVGVRDLIFEAGMNEQEGIDSLVEAIGYEAITDYYNSAEHSRGLHSFFSWSGNFSSDYVHNAAALFFFYTFCLMMTWKISRDQTAVDLRIENKKFNKELKSILRLRSQIINVERFFFTKNISNDRNVKAISRSMKRRYRLERKMEGFLSLNESMEQLLVTNSQRRTDDKIATLNLVAFLIAAFGLPTAVFSAILAINVDNSPVLSEGVQAITSEQVLYVASLVFSVTLAPLILVAIGYLIYFKLYR